MAQVVELNAQLETLSKKLQPDRYFRKELDDFRPKLEAPDLRAPTPCFGQCCSASVPASDFTSVDLPAPFGPSRPILSP